MVELTVCCFFLFWQHLATHIYSQFLIESLRRTKKLFRAHAYTIHQGGGTKKEYLWSFYKISAMALGCYSPLGKSAFNVQPFPGLFCAGTPNREFGSIWWVHWYPLAPQFLSYQICKFYIPIIIQM